MAEAASRQQFAQSSVLESIINNTLLLSLQITKQAAMVTPVPFSLCHREGAARLHLELLLDLWSCSVHAKAAANAALVETRSIAQH